MTHRHSSRYDSLLSILNKCSTSMGKRMFKDRLCHPITDPTELQQRYQQVAFFREQVKIESDTNANVIVNNINLEEPVNNIYKYKYKYKIYEPYLMNISDLERAHRIMTMGRFLPSAFIGL